jgi:hypothetical protein
MPHAVDSAAEGLVDGLSVLFSFEMKSSGVLWM